MRQDQKGHAPPKAKKYAMMSKPRARRLLQVLAHPELAALSVMPVRDANAIRSEAVQDAFRSLTPREQGLLQVQAEWLATEIPKLGPSGALEVLAAIGIALDDAKKI